MKGLLFMVIVTIVVLASFARPEKDTSVTPAGSSAIKNTANHLTTGDSTVQYKKG